MTDVLDRYINPSFVYRFSQGPDVVQTPEDALRKGINCISLAHLALRDIFNYQLTSELQCAEMYLDTHTFTKVNSIADMRRGDLVWFGVDKASIEPEEFIPVYNDGALTNWADFPVKHATVHTGKFDREGNPLLLHSTHVEGTNTIWPLPKFAEYQKYRKLYGITRLILDH
ncbi:MAG TPA: hypothetical protein VK983_04365 [Candidatus Limnocylindrales bacterium]|nr:hypothetical protein [Candidatus Limnocylindrales bacterium]